MKEQILNNLIEMSDIDMCGNYGEMGYKLEGKKGVLLSNWDKFNKYPNFMEWLENSYELECSDEWIIDYDLDKCYRVVGNSYGWQIQIRINDTGEIITPDSDIDLWVEYCKVDLNRTENRCLPYFMVERLKSETDFELIQDDFEHGFYGKTDKPAEIAKKIFQDTDYKDLIFVLDYSGQFSIGFSLYGRR